MLPLSIWAGLIIFRKLSNRELTASFLGMLWFFHTTLIINIIASKMGAWTFIVTDNLFYSVPIDWVIAQSIIIGALIPLTRFLKFNTIVRFFLQVLTIVFIYYFSDVIQLEFKANSYLLIIALFSLSAMFLSDWTSKDIYIRSRSFLQSLIWILLLFWMFPSILFYLTEDSWEVFLNREFLNTSLYLLPMLLPLYLVSAAIYQFAIEGGGTAFPYDPPKILVTGGIYRYISNPMQLGICLAMAWWGVVTGSGYISFSAVIAVFLFIVFKDVCNGSCAIGKNNSKWEEYQRTVPKWLPRFK